HLGGALLAVQVAPDLLQAERERPLRALDVARRLLPRHGSPTRGESTRHRRRATSLVPEGKSRTPCISIHDCNTSSVHNQAMRLCSGPEATPGCPASSRVTDWR